MATIAPLVLVAGCSMAGLLPRRLVDGREVSSKFLAGQGSGGLRWQWQHLLQAEFVALERKFLAGRLPQRHSLAVAASASCSICCRGEHILGPWSDAPVREESLYLQENRSGEHRFAHCSRYLCRRIAPWSIALFTAIFILVGEPLWVALFAESLIALGNDALFLCKSPWDASENACCARTCSYNCKELQKTCLENPVDVRIASNGIPVIMFGHAQTCRLCVCLVLKVVC